MTKRLTTVFCIAVSAVAWFGVQAQSPTTAKLEFEVASVKQNVSESQDSKPPTALRDRFTATNTPLIFFVLYAYDLKGYQLAGLPEWASDKAYDVVGTFPADKPHTETEVRVMVQNLLADRFGLKVHHEQRTIPAYDLVVARKDGRLGPQLVKSNVDCAAWMAQKHRPSRTDTGGPSPVMPSGKRPECTILASRTFLSGGAQTMQDLVAPLGLMVSKPIVDKTGLKGAYDIDLKWDSTGLAVDRSKPGATSEAPSIFTAVEEQLGLKLVSHKEAFDMVVVDGIKPPSAN